RTDRLLRLAVRRTVAAATAEGELPLRIRELPLEQAAFLDHLLHAVHHLVRLRPQQPGQLAHARLLGNEIGARAVAGQRLDAAHAGRARALGNDVDQSDVAGARDVGSAAQLDRPRLVRARLRLAHRDDTDLV